MVTLPDRYLGIGSAMLSMIRNMGMALGVAAGKPNSLQLRSPHHSWSVRVLRTGFVLFLQGLRYAYLFSAGVSLLAAVSSLLATYSPAQ